VALNSLVSPSPSSLSSLSSTSHPEGLGSSSPSPVSSSSSDSPHNYQPLPFTFSHAGTLPYTPMSDNSHVLPSPLLSLSSSSSSSLKQPSANRFCQRGCGRRVGTVSDVHTGSADGDEGVCSGAANCALYMATLGFHTSTTSASSHSSHSSSSSFSISSDDAPPDPYQFYYTAPSEPVNANTHPSASTSSDDGDMFAQHRAPSTSSLSSSSPTSSSSVSVSPSPFHLAFQPMTSSSSTFSPLSQNDSTPSSTPDGFMSMVANFMIVTAISFDAVIAVTLRCGHI
jgi:hypothetical protein